MESTARGPIPESTCGFTLSNTAVCSFITASVNSSTRTLWLPNIWIRSLPKGADYRIRKTEPVCSLNTPSPTLSPRFDAKWTNTSDHIHKELAQLGTSMLIFWDITLKHGRNFSDDAPADLDPSVIHILQPTVFNENEMKNQKLKTKTELSDSHLLIRNSSYHAQHVCYCYWLSLFNARLSTARHPCIWIGAFSFVFTWIIHWESHMEIIRGKCWQCLTMQRLVMERQPLKRCRYSPGI